MVLSTPELSVILPVFNAEKYVGHAIQSVLQQSFSGFELIIIDDCSSDGTEKELASFNDERIRVYRNEINLGPADSMNRGLELVSGKYVAIMHADDECLPARFEKQVSWLDQHPGCALVAGFARMQGAKPWTADRVNVTSEAIREFLPKDNCIAHATVMARTDLVGKFGYAPGLRNSEDYELWLQMASAGLTLEKIPEELVNYRVHENSLTGKLLAHRSGRLVNARCKKIFLERRKSFGSRNAFDRKVQREMWLDLLAGAAQTVKRALSPGRS